MPELTPALTAWRDLLSAYERLGWSSLEVSILLQKAAKELSADDWYYVLNEYQENLVFDETH